MSKPHERHHWIRKIAKCKFEGETNGLVYGIFNQNMQNKAALEKKRTEPKDSAREALQFVVAFEEAIKRQILSAE